MNDRLLPESPVKPKVIISPHFRTMDEIFRPEAMSRLSEVAEVVWGIDEPMPQSQFEKALDAAVAVVFGTWRYGDALTRGGPNVRAALEVLGAHDHHGLGYELCLSRGIEVGSAAPAFGPAVAELGLGLTLAVTRGIAINDRDFRAGNEQWMHEGNVGFDTLFGRAVGFVGCGGLSQHLQQLLAPFGVRFLGYDPFVPGDTLRNRGIEPLDLEPLFEISDVVYVLAAPTEGNRGLIDRSLMERLGPSQAMILISRASLVDFDALTDLVVDGRFRLGIDVFPTEPLPDDHPLRSADTAVLSSHRAGAVPGALLAIGDMVVADLMAMITGSDDRQMQYLTREMLPALLQPMPE